MSELEVDSIEEGGNRYNCTGCIIAIIVLLIVPIILALIVYFGNF